MRRIALLLITAAALVPALAGSASADPTNHFGTFEIQCGSDLLVIVSKPGSSNVVTVNGEPSNSVSILMGLTMIENGEVVFEFHKPFALNHPEAVRVCSEVDPGPGLEVIVETLLTPH
jgi:hypothetical protein